jgi:hypothetical protein
MTDSGSVKGTEPCSKEVCPVAEESGESTATINYIIRTFDVKRALKAWQDRGISEDDLIMIVRYDLEHCRRKNQAGSARNIERMLEVLES